MSDVEGFQTRTEMLLGLTVDANLDLRAENSALKEENERLKDALRITADRWFDLAALITAKGKYDNAGFAKASGDRCLRVLAGGTYNDELFKTETSSSEPLPASDERLQPEL